MTCKCGFANNASARFCGQCGLALDETTAEALHPLLPTSPTTTISSRKRLSPAFLSAVVILLVGALGAYKWLHRPPGQYKPDNSGLYPISVNDKYGFMDRSGKTVIPPQFEGTYGFSEGLAPVRIGTKFGFINTAGVVTITPQFDQASGFRYGRAVVSLGPQQNGFIDTEGKYINTPEYAWAGNFSEGLAFVGLSGGLGTAFVDRSGKIVIPSRGPGDSFWAGAEFRGGLAPAAAGVKWGYIDPTGKWAIEPQFESALNFVDGLAPVVVGGRTGYIDQKGKFVINPQYRWAGEFHEDRAIYRTDEGKLGFIDKKGNALGDTKFTGVRNFSEGLAAVETDKAWGFIDSSGNMVINPEYDSVEPFQNGLALVAALGKVAYITKSGAFVVSPFPGTTLHAEKERLAAAARAEQDRIAAEAARAAQEELQAKAANRSRVEQGIIAGWIGTFGFRQNVPLTITRESGAITAVLINDGWRETLTGQFLSDDELLLTGTNASRIGAGSPAYSLDTLQLTLSNDGISLAGSYHDAGGNRGYVAMRKSS